MGKLTGVDFLGAGLDIGTNLLSMAHADAAASKQREWQEKMWNESNVYNSPSQMAARMRAAGLNPYAATDANPAASFGTGSAAQTPSMRSPTDSLIALAQIDNLDASTSKTTQETTNLVQQLAILDAELKFKIITNQEYEVRLKYLFEEWEKRNPFTVEREFKESQTSANEASAAESYADVDKSTSEARQAEADAVYKAALAKTEESLREPKKALLYSQKANQDAQAQAAMADAQLKIQQGKALELENERLAFTRAAEQFYGIVIDNLNPNFAADLLANYSNVLANKMSPEAALKEFERLLNTYQQMTDWWKPESKTDSGSGSIGGSFLWGLVSANISGSGSRSRTGNSAK